MRLEEAMVIQPPDPFEGGEFDVFEVAPRTTWTNKLGLVEPNDRLGQGENGGAKLDHRAANRSCFWAE